uniref:Uncharacterized protein n=1 Tax=Plectus sambesii TaxID=2011161 RepID=A0A914WFE6_9BILA
MFNPLALVADLFGLPTWLPTIVALAVFLYWYGARKLDFFKNRGAPYVEGALPFAGNFLNVVRHGFTDDLQRINKYGRMFGELHGSVPIWVIADPELVREVGIKEFSSFTNRRKAGFAFNPEFKKALHLVEDSEWKGIRNVMTHGFSSAKMKRMVPLIQHCADEFADSFQQYLDQNKEFEAKELCGNFTMDVIATTQFGIEVSSSKEAGNHELIKHVKLLFASLSIKNPVIMLTLFIPSTASLLERFGIGVFNSRAMSFISNYINRLCQLRSQKTEKPVNFLELMLSAYDEDLDDPKDTSISVIDDTTEYINKVKDWRNGKKTLSMHEIISNSILFFIAGYDTTSTAMCWMFHELAHNPDIQENLYQEIEETIAQYGSLTYDAVASMKYLDQVFCETTRMYPPAQRTDRICTEDCKIGGHLIRKGEILNIPIYGIHMNPDYWPEPEEFRPERFAKENAGDIVPYSYLAFGVGPRGCVGQRLAVLESKIGVVTALRRFRFVPSENAERHPKFNTLGTCSAINGIHLRVESRS